MFFNYVVICLVYFGCKYMSSNFNLGKYIFLKVWSNNHRIYIFVFICVRNKTQISIWDVIKVIYSTFPFIFCFDIDTKKNYKINILLYIYILLSEHVSKVSKKLIDKTIDDIW